MAGPFEETQPDTGAQWEVVGKTPAGNPILRDKATGETIQTKSPDEAAGLLLKARTNTIGRWVTPTPKPGAAPTPAPAATGKEGGFTPAFFQKLTRIAKGMGADPQDLWAVMRSEAPKGASDVNKYSGATGLIQFMPYIAERLGTSVEELKTMPPEQQLGYVEKYFKRVPNMPEKPTLRHLYSAVFSPSPNSPLNVSDGYHTLGEMVDRASKIRAQMTPFPEAAPTAAPEAKGPTPPASQWTAGILGEAPKPAAPDMTQRPELSAIPELLRRPQKPAVAPAKPAPAPTAAPLPPGASDLLPEMTRPGQTPATPNASPMLTTPDYVPATPDAGPQMTRVRPVPMPSVDLPTPQGKPVPLPTPDMPSPKYPAVPMPPINVPAPTAPTAAPQMTREGWEAESRDAAAGKPEPTPAPEGGPLDIPPAPPMGEQEAPKTPDVSDIPSILQGPPRMGESQGINMQGRTSDIGAPPEDPAQFQSWMQERFDKANPPAPAAAPAAAAPKGSVADQVTSALRPPKLPPVTSQSLPGNKGEDNFRAFNVGTGKSTAGTKTETVGESEASRNLKEMADKLKAGVLAERPAKEPGETAEEYYKRLRGEADTKVGDLMKNYYAETDDHRKKQMWDTIIQSLGGIAAGATNLLAKGPGGTPINAAKYYQEKPVYDRKYEDDIAAKQMEMGIKPIESNLEKLLGLHGKEEQAANAASAKSREDLMKLYLEVLKAQQAAQPGEKITSDQSREFGTEQKIEDADKTKRAIIGKPVKPDTPKLDNKIVDLSGSIKDAEATNKKQQEAIQLSREKITGPIKNKDHFFQTIATHGKLPITSADARARLWWDGATNYLKKTGRPIPSEKDFENVIKDLPAAAIGSEVLDILSSFYRTPTSKADYARLKAMQSRYPGLTPPAEAGIAVLDPNTGKTRMVRPSDFEENNQ